jgi:hypothetical protein
VTQDSKVPDHVPIFEHYCKQHGWERCAVAASLVDPTKEAQHACSHKLEMPVRRVPFRGVAREVAEPSTERANQPRAASPQVANACEPVARKSPGSTR